MIEPAICACTTCVYARDSTNSASTSLAPVRAHCARGAIRRDAAKITEAR